MAEQGLEVVEEEPRGRRWLRTSVLVLMVLLGVGALTTRLLYQVHVVDGAGPQFERAYVLGIIADESPVYYRDGQTRVGVFFDDEHRTYVPWEELPPAYVASILASEDSRFWRHPGFDPKHIARAMRDNIVAGEVVAGGSTLTQQTAKNLFYRPDRTLRSKLLEALNGLRLEAHFDKTEILTFYANQFHVSGNGRGLGIAARHFFDKEVSELTVLECAFLAGLVKAPSYYDPFLGDAGRRDRAIVRAHDRTRYVLRRLVEEDPIALAGPPGDRDPARRRATATARREAQRLLNEGFTLNFKRGVFRYESSAVIDEVARRLSEPPFDEVLAAAGITDPATAGLRVVTTLDPDVQREAVYGLWHHLTEVGTMLEAIEPASFVRPDSRGPRFDPDHAPAVHEFRLARVEEVLEPAGRKHLQVDLGGHDCVVDRDAIVRAALAVERGRKASGSAKVPTAQVDGFVDALPVGSVVWVSVRGVSPAGAACDLEVRPDLQGASIVLDEGRILAMVGGNDNRNFNRATALRQLGSTWKPVVFHAAMRLGWSPEDVLDNGRNVFPFSTTFYYPRPDHDPLPEVSLSWAGVQSENLASIWLLYHLTDRLSPEEIAALAESLGLARSDDEATADYRLRIQRAGVLPTPSRVQEAFFLQARTEVLADIATASHPEDAPALASVLFGWGYRGELRRVSGDEVKERALGNHWGHLLRLRQRCETQHQVLEDVLAVGRFPAAGSVSDLSGRRVAGRVDLACGERPDGYGALEPSMFAIAATPGVVPVRDVLRNVRLWVRPDSGQRLPPPAFADTLLDDRIHVSTVDAVQSSIDLRRRYRELEGEDAPGLYHPEVLYWHQDFRVLLGMRYVAALAESYGVRTGVQEVLSLPLGASEATIEEMTAVYSGLTSGVSWQFPGRAGSKRVPSPAASTLLIAEVRDVDDQVLYRAVPEGVVVAAPEVGAMTTDILRNVVQWGTGRRAKSALELGGASLPVGGKTGTTNDFRNAAFVGVVPTVGKRGAVGDRGVSVGVYVGYDDNRPMTSGTIRLAGASGALPAWIGAARGAVAAGLAGDVLRVAPEGGWVVDPPEGLVRRVVDTTVGGLLSDDPDGPASVLTRQPAPEVVVEAGATRFVDGGRRIRIAPSTRALERILQEREEEARDAPAHGAIWRRRRPRAIGTPER